MLKSVSSDKREAPDIDHVKHDKIVLPFIVEVEMVRSVRKGAGDAVGSRSKAADELDFVVDLLASGELQLNLLGVMRVGPPDNVTCSVTDQHAEYKTRHCTVR